MWCADPPEQSEDESNMLHTKGSCNVLIIRECYTSLCSVLVTSSEDIATIFSSRNRGVTVNSSTKLK